MNVARDGQQSGKVSTALVNVVPLAARRRFTFGSCARSAVAMSSVITTRMFGRPSFAAATVRAWAAEPRKSKAGTAATTARSHGPRPTKPPAR